MSDQQQINEIRIRAKQFAQRWQDESSERRGAVTFWDEFFLVYGLYRRQYAQVEYPLKRGRRIDLFWPKMLLVEHKGRGLLRGAFDQALGYVNEIRQSDRPRYIVTCDYEDFHLYAHVDGSYKTSATFKVKDLPDNIESFGFLVGMTPVRQAPLDDLNFSVAEKLGSVFESLQSDKYDKDDLSEFLVRIVFCMFADHTGIFEKGAFAAFMRNAINTNQNIGAVLNALFDTLDTATDRRSVNLSEELKRFPHVNGQLFRRTLRSAPVTESLAEILFEIAKADWRRVSPAVFGALFQCVMDDEKRANLGEHYTSERNILRTIEPLFIDELRSEIKIIKQKVGPQKRGLIRDFRKKLSQIQIFDPACGCGNFLVVAYRELRLLDIEAIKISQEGLGGTQQLLDTADFGSCSITSMHGLEVESFPCRVAEVALWMIDHLMNAHASEELGKYYIRLPLDVKADIRNVNALRVDWDTILPGNASTFLVGNPPFVGAHLQSKSQKDDIKLVFQAGRNLGDLDYVCCWFVKTAYFLKGRKHRKGALVATSSIAQGEQVAVLWSAINKIADLRLSFAYKSFKWNNEAPKSAQVFVIILGMQVGAPERPVIYTVTASSDTSKAATNISPYVLDHASVIVTKRSKALTQLPRMLMGNKPSDGGHLILDKEDKEAIIEQLTTLGLEKHVEDVIRPFVGTTELIYGRARWCLWLKGQDISRFNTSSIIRERVQKVKEFRLKSTADDTIKAADTPHLFFRTPQGDGPCIVFPETTSENREYIPLGRYDDKTIFSNLVFFVNGHDMFVAGILMSHIHQLWARSVGGRFENRIRYSSRAVYNTFPLPREIEDASRETIETSAANIFDIQKNFGLSLEELYDPLRMPADLRAAHRLLDTAVEQCFRKKAFGHDEERFKFMLDAYQNLLTPLKLATPGKRVRQSNRKDA